MATIELTPAVLRALGEGVARLRDGDMYDDALQKEVVETLEKLGYRYGGYNFAHVDRTLVVSHLHYRGADVGVLTNDEEVAVRTLADGFGVALSDEAFWDWSNVRDSSDAAISAMAAKIREIREAKGLVPDPNPNL